MAEGHAVLRWARRLHALVGSSLQAIDLPARWEARAAGIPGQQITDVETHGKHLLIHLSSGLTLHCHAMMFGSWQFGPPGMRLRKPESRVRLRLRTDSGEAVFYNGPVVEVLTPDERANHDRLNALGPDLLHPDFDRDETWRRLQRAGRRELGDAVLDQRIVAGIGNIFKSEGLFIARLDPRRSVATLTRADAERIWDHTIPIMARSARGSGPIQTLDRQLRRGGERYWAYRRSGRACFRCGTSIEMVRQGGLQRTSYFCPECQS